MNPKEIFDSADSIINRIEEILKSQSLELHKRGLPLQKLNDLQRGLVYKNGVYVSLSSIEHHILLDGYEVIFLDTFISLFDEVFRSKENLLTQLSLRTLAEMGFPRAQILFDISISKEEKEKFKLLIMLADYGFIGRDRSEHIKSFEKLYEENKESFTENQKVLLLDYLEATKKNNLEEHIRLTKKVRKLADSYQDQLFKKTSILPIFRPGNIEALFSGFSHILHGNVLLLSDILKNKRPNQHRLRVYWFLLLTGINIVNQLNSYLNKNGDLENISELNKDFGVVAQKVSSYWATL